MIRILTIFLQLVIILLISNGCSSRTAQLAGNPQEPYPLLSKPEVGQIVHIPTGRLVTEEQMLAIAADSRVVYVGETHDNPASHRLELLVLKALVRRYPAGVAIGMEMFSRTQQPALNRWVAGLLDEKTFLKESRWYYNWKMDFRYYRDLLNFARAEHIPVIALDADKNLVKAVRSKTLTNLSSAEQSLLPEIDLTDRYQHDLVTTILGDHSHKGMIKDGFIQAQTLRDETMAESIFNYLKTAGNENKHLLVMAGGDHISYGFGIPRRLFRRIPLSYTLIAGREINIQPDKRDRFMDLELPDFPMQPFQFIVYQNYEDLPEQSIKLGVAIETAKDNRGLRVTALMPDSNAARIGLQQGDLILAIDKESVAEPFNLTYLIQQKQVGDSIILSIERDGKIFNLEGLLQGASKQ